MAERNLFTKIRLEILGTDTIIEDADISVELKKTEEKTKNICEITIYNLSDDTYNRINEKTNSVRVYTDIDGQGYVLFFQGDLRQLQKHKKAVKKPKKTAKVHYNEPSIYRKYSGNDIETIITLEDGMKQYFLNNYVSKSYSGAVTNKTILNDLIQQAKRTNNIEVSANFDDIEEFTFPNGKTCQGDFTSVISNLCKVGKCNCKINNNIIIIQKQEIQGSSFGYVLNGYNCPKPEPGTDKKIEILAPFLPAINPLDFVKLEFDDYDGVYKVIGVESKIDNFGQEYETKITVTY